MQGVTVQSVLDRLATGARLHRVASARHGHYWVLMPGSEPGPSEVAEAASCADSVVAEGWTVGRVSWMYKGSAADSAG